LAVVLDYLHNLDPPVIFRDLKPSNVMVQPDGTLKLVDFGIARFFKPGQTADTVYIGTPGYASPEQYGGSQTDPRSDVYSLAVLLHHLLTGFNPAMSPVSIPPAQELRPDLAPHVSAAIGQALQVDPAKRFNSVMAFAMALGAPIPDPSTPTKRVKPDSLPPTRKLGGWLRANGLFLAGGLLIIIALALFFIFRPQLGLDGTIDSDRDQEEAETGEDSLPAEIAEENGGRSTIDLGAMGDEKSTPTLESSHTPVPTTPPAPTSTPRPTSTPFQSPTPRPSDTPEPTTPPTSVCTIPVHPGFQDIYRVEFETLGCPVNTGHLVWIAQQQFYNGRMFWRQDNEKIYVLYGNGTWARYDDIWTDSLPEFSCGTPESPPTPKRGFGMTWCTYDAVRSGLGNATTGEWGDTQIIQDFEGGSMFIHSGQTYTLRSTNGTWR
jgi:serine/threonine protein kinase